MLQEQKLVKKNPKLNPPKRAWSLCACVLMEVLISHYWVQASNSRTEEEMDEEERKCAGSRGPPSNDNEPFYSFCNGPRLEHLKKIQGKN